MIKLEQPVIVEGKYDKIALENLIDALIIPTEGFGIFKNKEKCDMIRTLAQKYGVIVMTDSDSAGNMIRAYIKKIVGNSRIINVYIPCLKGKEKRKTAYSKEGFLGVEGMSLQVLKAALERSGVKGREITAKEKQITKTDMFEWGLSGGENSADLRKKLLNHLCLPESLSPNAMLDILNTLFTHGEFVEVVTKWQKDLTKS